MTDMHIIAVGSVDLVLALVLVMHRELVQSAGEVMSNAGVGVPVGINTIGHQGALFLVISFHIIIITVGVVFIAPPAVACWVAVDLADLTSDVDERSWCMSLVVTVTLPPFITATVGAASRSSFLYLSTSLVALTIFLLSRTHRGNSTHTRIHKITKEELWLCPESPLGTKPWLHFAGASPGYLLIHLFRLI
jgi:hypothetical protein